MLLREMPPGYMLFWEIGHLAESCRDGVIDGASARTKRSTLDPVAFLSTKDCLWGLLVSTLNELASRIPFHFSDAIQTPNHSLSLHL